MLASTLSINAAFHEGGFTPWIILFAMPASAWIVLVIWPWLATDYEITPTELVIRFGMRRRVIQLRDIVEASPTKSMFRIAQNYIWSLDRILIRHRRGNGIAWMPVAIAPADKAGFLRELRSLVPELKVDDAASETH